jgi:hypothetical protein
VFHHPLIRMVAYESQLKSDRAELHRRLAAAIEARSPASADENAALIAEHLEAAGDLHPAYQWHMRAATWATNRDITAARLSWERARKIADALPANDPNRAAMRIAPRTMLCGTAYRVREHVAGARFEELRQLCTAAGDKASLAIAMAGLVADYAYQDRIDEASQLASEAMALIESVGDPTLTVGLSFAAIYAKLENAEYCDVLRWSQGAIDLADGDPSTGNFIIGCPLALAFTTRALARYSLGRPGWPDDLRHGLDMARTADPLSYAAVVGFAYLAGIPAGVLRPDDSAVPEMEVALKVADRSGDDHALAIARMTLGLALAHRQTDADRDHGHELLAEVSDVFLRGGYLQGELPLVNVYVAREKARRGDRDAAITLMRAAVDHLFRQRHPLAWGIPATGVLVETLLDRGTDSDVAEAAAGIERLAAAPADDGLVIRDIWLLRLRALLARARHGGLHSGVGVIGEVVGGTEDGQRPVTEELIDVPTGIDDRRHHDVEQGIEAGDGVLGGVGLGERGEVTDVDEHDRHLAALPGKYVIPLLKQTCGEGWVDVGAERGLKSLSLSQTGLHAVERRRQRTEVVVLNHRQALAVVTSGNPLSCLGEVANGTQGRRDDGTDGVCPEAERQRGPDHNGEDRDLTGRIQHGPQHRAHDGKREHGGGHREVQPCGIRRARPRQGVSDPRVPGEGGPGRSRGSLRKGMHTGQGCRESCGGAHDPVLDEPRPARSGDHTDNDQQQCGPHREEPNPRTPAARLHVYVSFSAASRSTSSPAAHR